jgi:hypothetical protein
MHTNCPAGGFEDGTHPSRAWGIVLTTLPKGALGTWREKKEFRRFDPPKSRKKNQERMIFPKKLC